MPEDESLDEMIARLLAERLVELGLPADLARGLARGATPRGGVVEIAQVDEGIAVGVSRRSGNRVPRRSRPGSRPKGR